MRMSVTTREADRQLTARLVGDLDRDAEEPLTELQETFGDFDRVVLDFTETSFISSSGLALLVGLARAASAAGPSLHATGLDDHYRHVFEITQLDRVIAVDERTDASKEEET